MILTDTIPLPPEKMIPSDDGPECCPPLRGSDQANPPQRIGQPAVWIDYCSVAWRCSAKICALGLNFVPN